ncbi:peptidase [Malaciobacter molluscorum]|uniref:S24 family peptidase n=1 Tax=Malaciobacter molluscorum TaxID=1032072 RepID=UPI00100BBCD0|nr:S24 family peptidase [Malaciobacter molluscorum]RXJ96486.1 peptidase [Malaciobacter molluscorum]
MNNIITLEYTDVFDENRQKKVTFSQDLIPSKTNVKSLFAILVDGKSMQPKINDKAIVIADLSSKEVEDDSIYIVYYDNKMWVKKAILKQNSFLFISINEDYKHLGYKQEDVYVVAKAILTFTKL